MKERIEEFKAETRKFQKEVRTRTIGYIVAAFGLVVGLAWNEAIRAAIEYVFPLTSNSLLAKFSYAAIMTLMLVLITGYLLRSTDKNDE